MEGQLGAREAHSRMECLKCFLRESSIALDTGVAFKSPQISQLLCASDPHDTDDSSISDSSGEIYGDSV